MAGTGFLPAGGGGVVPTSDVWAQNPFFDNILLKTAWKWNKLLLTLLERSLTRGEYWIRRKTVIYSLTEKRACEGGIHVELILEVFRSERSEARD